jgi:hypothetical protein
MRAPAIVRINQWKRVRPYPPSRVTNPADVIAVRVLVPRVFD